MYKIDHASCWLSAGCLRTQRNPLYAVPQKKESKTQVRCYQNQEIEASVHPRKGLCLLQTSVMHDLNQQCMTNNLCLDF